MTTTKKGRRELFQGESKKKVDVVEETGSRLEITRKGGSHWKRGGVLSKKRPAFGRGRGKRNGLGRGGRGFFFRCTGEGISAEKIRGGEANVKVTGEKGKEPICHAERATVLVTPWIAGSSNLLRERRDLENWGGSDRLRKL